MTPAEQAAYNLGFARGSGDEGHYQREIARLRQRCWALALLAYGDDPPREAVEGDI